MFTIDKMPIFKINTLPLSLKPYFHENGPFSYYNGQIVSLNFIDFKFLSQDVI